MADKKLKKITLYIVLFLVFISSVVAFCIYPKNDEKVTLNITLKDNCLMDYYEDSFGSFNNFLKDENTKKLEKNILENQNQVFNHIKNQAENVSLISRSNNLSNNITITCNKKDVKKIKDNDILKINEESFLNYPCDEIDNKKEDETFKNDVTNQGIFDSSKLETINGEGMLIGIIDCGVEIGHEAFSTMPKGEMKYPDNSYLTDDIINNLNAKGDKNSLYKNQKVVFAYDYFDSDTDPENSSDDWHGTHVAGIAAGNNGKDFFGASPQAQLAVFKVFGNRNMGASSLNILKAIEDAVVIGCDVINLSLGGNTLYKTQTTYTDVLENARKAGVAVVISNGNDGASLKYRSYDLTSSDFTDISATSSPASEKYALGVGNCLGDFSKMHYSSSWGTLANLEIKPDVSAPGTEVLSAITEQDNKISRYDKATGTSMAAPNLTGAVANMMRYIDLNSQLFGNPTLSERVELCENLIMSNADPIKYEDAFYSPRQQGAGVADYYDIENTKFMLSTENNGRPKVSLGVDEYRSGNYNFNFYVKNFTNEDQMVNFDFSTFCDKVDENGKLPLLPEKLNPKVNFYNNFEKIESLLLKPKQNALIDVSIVLNKNDKELLNKTFKNGCFVEGYIFVNSGTSDLSLPYLAYYGGINESGMFSSKGTGEPQIIAETPLYGYTDSIKLGMYNFPYTESEYTKDELYYLKNSHNKFAFNPIRTTLTEIDYKILRETDSVNIMMKNANSDQIYFAYNSDEIYSKWVVSLKAGYDSYVKIPASCNNLFKMMENNEKISLTLKGKLPFLTDEENIYTTYITIDKEEPKVQSAKIRGNYLEFTASDNHYVQGYNVIGKTGANEKKLYENFQPVFNINKGCISTIKENIASINSFEQVLIELIDYAGNRQTYNVNDFNGENLNKNYDKIAPCEMNHSIKNLKTEDFTDNFGGKYRTCEDGYILTSLSGKSDSYKIEDGTKALKKSAINGSFKQIIFPETIKEIDFESLKNCKDLEKIIFLSYEAPNVIGNVEELKNVVCEIPYYNQGYSNSTYSKMFKNISVKDEIIICDDGKTEIITGNKTDEINLKNPIKEGYEFIGWRDEKGNLISDKTTINNNAVYADYQLIQGDIKILSDDKCFIKQYNYGDKIHLFNLNKDERYEIESLTVDGNKIDNYDDLIYKGGDMVIKYNYKDRTYNITLVYYDENAENIIINYGENLPVPSREGYIFDGWYKDKNLNIKKDDVNYKDGITLYAKWEKDIPSIESDSSSEEKENSSSEIIESSENKEGGCKSQLSPQNLITTIMAFCILISIRTIYKKRIN